MRDRRDVARLVRDAHGARQTRGNAVAEFLRVQDVEHLARELRREGALLGDQSQQLHETVGGDAIVDPELERALVLDAATNVDAVDAELVETALHRLEPDEIEQQIRREVAARRDHVQREIGDAHHLADRRVHLGVRVAIGEHAKRTSVDRARRSGCARAAASAAAAIRDGSPRRRRARIATLIVLAAWNQRSA